MPSRKKGNKIRNKVNPNSQSTDQQKNDEKQKEECTNEACLNLYEYIIRADKISHEISPDTSFAMGLSLSFILGKGSSLSENAMDSVF